MNIKRDFLRFYLEHKYTIEYSGILPEPVNYRKQKSNGFDINRIHRNIMENAMKSYRYRALPISTYFFSPVRNRCFARGKGGAREP